ncbi:AEC family transporter [Hwanghaeella grinnelliae]|uniref:AEC family transporter n=2 Tax=Hwanghaeella grinnelliae TaxID=2500179 RepID=A0A3S2ZBB2_9PROT|nr:AEC family transporter [Hwanghaeella grinnelliae]
MIVLGHALRRGGIPNADFWNLNDKLVYWVLMPALLFYKTSTIEISLHFIGSYASVLIGAFAAAGLVGTGLAKLAGLPNPIASSVLQGSARHNTFIALAVAERVYGTEGLAVAALATSILIPITNVTMVSAMVSMHRKAGTTGFVGPILRDLGRNPLLISVLLGLTMNLAGIGRIPVLHETLGILGAAALPIVLMCVGANIRLRAMQTSTLPVLFSVIGKMIVFPVMIVVLSKLLGLTTLEMTIALLFGAAPTASSAYTLARQMGGDAPLMAAIVTIQTGLSFLTLPLTVYLVERYFT